MKLTNKLYLALIALLVVSIPIATYAGGPGFDNDVYTWGSGGGDDDDYNGGGDDDHHYGDDDCDDDGGNDIPLDGGIGFLGAAGAAFAIKKYRDNKHKNSK